MAAVTKITIEMGHFGRYRATWFQPDCVEGSQSYSSMAEALTDMLISELGAQGDRVSAQTIDDIAAKMRQVLR